MKTPKFLRQVSPLVIFAAMISARSADAVAVNTEWTGAGDNGSWATAANWSYGTVPSNSDGNAYSVYFNGGGNGYTSISGLGTRTITRIYFDTADCAAYTINGDLLSFPTGGGVTINAGVTNDQTINATINEGGGMTFINNSTSATLFLTGTLYKNASSTTNLSFSGAGNIAVNTITDNLKEGYTRNIIKSGSGTLTLSGSVSHTGTTALKGGAMLVNGDMGAATGDFSVVGVAVKTTLGGTGVIGGATTISGTTAAAAATLSAGTVDTVGKLTFNKSLFLTDNRVNTIFQIAGSSRGVSYDAIDIGLDQTLTYGGTLTLDITATLGAGTYDLFQFTDGFSEGGFSNVSLTGGVYNGFSFSELESGLWTASQGDTSFTFSQATGDLVVAVPEPQTWAMFLGGVATLMALRRKVRA